MKLLIDNADIERIKAIYRLYPVDGVTSNPSILAKTGRNPYAVLREIREFIGDEAQLHAQVISRTADRMVEEAHKMAGLLGRNLFVKIPSVPEGFRAMRELSREGFNVTATVVYTPMQAFLAAKSGADYVAPYVNRIDNLGADGVRTTKSIQDMLVKNGLKTEILAASFKNSQQFQALCEYGVGAATAAPDIIENLVKNASVDSAAEAFIADFEGLCGRGRSMLDCDAEDILR